MKHAERTYRISLTHREGSTALRVVREDEDDVVVPMTPTERLVLARYLLTSIQTQTTAEVLDAPEETDDE